MDKRFWAVIGIVIVGFLGFVAFNNNQQDSADKASGSVEATAHYTGALDSKVTLQEYGDYQCPACASFFPTLQAVKEKYADTVRFQFSNLPLTQLHPNAFAAARAAEAAGLQDKFWEYHDALYLQSNWNVWTQATSTDAYFEQYARQLNLDIEKFKTDAKSSRVNDMINADRAAFDKTGADQATPTYFLNGKKIDNAELLGADQQPSVEGFSKVLDAALADANKE